MHFDADTVLNLLEKHNCNLGELADHLDIYPAQLSAWIKKQDAGVRAEIAKYKGRNYKRGRNSHAYRATNSMLRKYPDSPYKKSSVTPVEAVALVIGSQFEALKK